MVKNKNMANYSPVSLGSYNDEYTSKETSTQQYRSTSEENKTAPQLSDNEDQMKEKLVSALILGERSPRVENFNAQAHLKTLHDRLK